jgi:hypothetical protein
MLYVYFWQFIADTEEQGDFCVRVASCGVATVTEEVSKTRQIMGVEQWTTPFSA